MQFVVPEILVHVRELSLGLVAVGLAVGLFLWLFGWWSHRFWVVLTTTVLAGIYGLYAGPAFQAQPLLAGLLLALSAGLLALALARILAFVAGGVAGLWAVQLAWPNVSQPLLCFLLCGLAGLLLFRVWMMALTSLSGSLLASYTALILLDRAGTMDAVEWATQATGLLNWLCGGIAVLGVLVQYFLDRRRQRKQEPDHDEEAPREGWDILGARSWLDRKKSYRKAG